MQDFSPTADIENEIKTVISDDNFSGENGEILGLKNPKKVRGELVASEGMERIEKAAAKAIIGTEQPIPLMGVMGRNPLFDDHWTLPVTLPFWWR